MASDPPTSALKRIRGSRATRKISRSGLTPAITLRQRTSVVPTHGVTSSTRRQNVAQGATTQRKRAGERPGSRRRNNVVAAAVGALEDSGVDFEDFIKMLRR